MSQIDVSKIAESIVSELDSLYKEDLYDLTVKKLEEPLAEGSSEQAVLLHGISTAVRNHSERFVIRLLQEVVNQLEQKS